MKKFTKKHLTSCIDHYKCTRLEDHLNGDHWQNKFWWCESCNAQHLNLKKKSYKQTVMDKLMGIKCRDCGAEFDDSIQLMYHEKWAHTFSPANGIRVSGSSFVYPTAIPQINGTHVYGYTNFYQTGSIQRAT